MIKRSYGSLRFMDSEEAKNRIESDRERTVLGLHPGGFYDG